MRRLDGVAAARVATDPADGTLAHLDGVNLSRTWMRERIAAGLPAGDPRAAMLLATTAVHRDSGLAAVRRATISAS